MFILYWAFSAQCVLHHSFWGLLMLKTHVNVKVYIATTGTRCFLVFSQRWVWCVFYTINYVCNLPAAIGVLFCFQSCIFPVNIPDPIQKHFVYGHYDQHAARIRLDCMCQIWLPASDSVPVCLFLGGFKGPGHIVQNQPRSNLDGLARFWPSASGPEASQCVRIIRPGSGRIQTACYQFPTFRLSCIIP